MDKNIVVSEKFVESYKLFNVTNQVEKIKSLDRKELLLLLLVAVDSFSEENLAAIDNYREFKPELELIFELQNDGEVTDIDLLELSKVTGEKYIDTSKIKMMNDKSLPDPLSDDEAKVMRREIGIDTIVE